MSANSWQYRRTLHTVPCGRAWPHAPCTAARQSHMALPAGRPAWRMWLFTPETETAEAGYWNSRTLCFQSPPAAWTGEHAVRTGATRFRTPSWVHPQNLGRARSSASLACSTALCTPPGQGPLPTRLTRAGSPGASEWSDSQPPKIRIVGCCASTCGWGPCCTRHTRCEGLTSAQKAAFSS